MKNKLKDTWAGSFLILYNTLLQTNKNFGAFVDIPCTSYYTSYFRMKFVQKILCSFWTNWCHMGNSVVDFSPYDRLVISVLDNTGEGQVGHPLAVC